MARILVVEDDQRTTEADKLEGLRLGAGDSVTLTFGAFAIDLEPTLIATVFSAGYRWTAVAS